MAPRDVLARLTATLLAAALLSGCRADPDRAGSGSPDSPGTWKRLEIAILEDYDKGEDLRGVAADFALFRELGIRVWRGSFGWDDYEPARGRYDFDWLHRFAELADRNGITLRPYIGYTPEWAAHGRRADGSTWNDPPARLEDWRRFVAALAASLRRHRNVVSYEIYNEENVREWWDGSAAEYYATLDAACREIRRVHPEAQVVLGGMVWPDPDWVEGACGAGAEDFDAVPFHAYPETWTPDSIRVENYIGATYRDLLEVVDACGGKPVWINETGFATTPGKSEADQARWWARALATFAAAPRVSLIGVYEIKDLRPERAAIGGAANYHLGLTRTDRTRKAAFHTVAMFARFFDAESIRVEDGGLRCRVREGDPSRVHRHLFRRPDGRRLLVLWSDGAPSRLEVTIPGGYGRVASIALDGRATPIQGPHGATLRELHLRPDDVRIFELDPPPR